MSYFDLYLEKFSSIYLIGVIREPIPFDLHPEGQGAISPPKSMNGTRGLDDPQY